MGASRPDFPWPEPSIHPVRSAPFPLALSCIPPLRFNGRWGHNDRCADRLKARTPTWPIVSPRKVQPALVSRLQPICAGDGACLRLVEPCSPARLQIIIIRSYPVAQVQRAEGHNRRRADRLKANAIKVKEDLILGRPR